MKCLTILLLLFSVLICANCQDKYEKIVKELKKCEKDLLEQRKEVVNITQKYLRLLRDTDANITHEMLFILQNLEQKIDPFTYSIENQMEDIFHKMVKPFLDIQNKVQSAYKNIPQPVDQRYESLVKNLQKSLEKASDDVKKLETQRSTLDSNLKSKLSALASSAYETDKTAALNQASQPNPTNLENSFGKQLTTDGNNVISKDAINAQQIAAAFNTTPVQNMVETKDFGDFIAEEQIKEARQKSKEQIKNIAKLESEFQKNVSKVFEEFNENVTRILKLQEGLEPDQFEQKLSEIIAKSVQVIKHCANVLETITINIVTLITFYLAALTILFGILAYCIRNILYTRQRRIEYNEELNRDSTNFQEMAVNQYVWNH